MAVSYPSLNSSPLHLFSEMSTAGTDDSWAEELRQWRAAYGPWMGSLGYVPISRKLGVLVETTFETLEDVCDDLFPWF